MSKIMSVFEKLNLVEKVEPENGINDSNIVVVSDNNKESSQDASEAEESDSNEEKVEDVPPAAEGKKTKPAETVSYDRNKSINEIYSLYNLENSNVNTIFMLGNFINALPENLPFDIKKSSVMSIVSAANADINKLLSDGENRLNALNKYANEYYNATSKAIVEYKEEIIKLSKMIDKYKEQINLKEALLEEQKNIVKYEAQKINNIIAFFDGEA